MKGRRWSDEEDAFDGKAEREARERMTRSCLDLLVALWEHHPNGPPRDVVPPRERLVYFAPSMRSSIYSSPAALCAEARKAAG